MHCERCYLLTHQPDFAPTIVPPALFYRCLLLPSFSSNLLSLVVLSPVQWNEITRYFRAGMPLRTHRQHFKKHCSCFTASEAADWLHEVLRSSSNFGPEVSRQQTVQLLRKFLKNHVIEDIKGRWGAENLEDNGALYRYCNGKQWGGI